MNKKFSVRYPTLIVATIMVSVLFLGCAGQKEAAKPAAASAAKTYDVIRAATPTDVVQTIDYYVGDELGFFEKEGIKIEYVGVVPAPQLVAGVVAGKIDVGGAHVGRTIAGISAGAKIKAVSAHLETTPDNPHMVYVVKANSPIKTPQDLIGKKIGISSQGGCHEYTPYAYLEKNGIPEPKGKVEFTLVPQTSLEQALRQGDIDVAGFHANPDQIGTKGEFRVLFSDYDVWGGIGGNAPTYFSEKFISEKPDVVRRFVTAMAKIHDWANANPQQAAEITARRAKVPVDRVRPVYYAPHALIKEETVTVWIELLKRFGEIKGDIRPDQIYTNEFNPFTPQAKK